MTRYLTFYLSIECHGTYRLMHDLSGNGVFLAQAC